MREKPAYRNGPQRRLYASTARTAVWIASRRAGKSFSIGDRIAKLLQMMPGARGCMGGGGSLMQARNRILPGIRSMMASEYGYFEYNKKTAPMGCYVIDKKPPNGWRPTIDAPTDYTNCITFLNGLCIDIISLRMRDSNRGPSYYFGIFDEAALYNPKHLQKEVFPSISGGKYFRDCPLYRSIFMASTMPWTARGRYLFDYEQLAIDMPDKYFYQESDIWDNVQVVGAEYIHEQQRILDPIIFDVEFMNNRQAKIVDGFYHGFAGDNEYGNNVQNYDPHYDPMLPLRLSLDPGASHSFLTCSQVLEEKRAAVQIAEIDQSGPENLGKIAAAFCSQYKYHINKRAVLVGDVNARKPADAQSKLSQFEELRQAIAAGGWDIEMQMAGVVHNPRHYEKWKTINAACQGHGLYQILVNADACPYTVQSINLARQNPDHTKNKDSEKDPNRDPRTATHYSDCFDYAVMPLLSGSTAVTGSGGMSIETR